MCDEERESTREATRAVWQAMMEYLPKLSPLIRAELKPMAEAQFAADAAVSPKYAELTSELYKQYGPEAAKTAAGIEDILNKAASARELELAQGTGKELVTTADELQRILDPEYYKNRERISEELGRFLNLSGPQVSEAELEAMRRGIGKVQFNPASAIDTAANAMQFGQLGRQRVMDFGAAIMQAAQAIPAMRSGIPAFEVATRRQVGATGERFVEPSSRNTGQAALDLSNNFLNNISAFQQQRMQKQKSLMENVTGWGEFGGRVVGAAAGAAMCWVAREVYGVDNPKWLEFREYVLFKAPSWFRWLYLKFGERFAKFISDKPKIKSLVRRWMDKITK